MKNAIYCFVVSFVLQIKKKQIWKSQEIAVLKIRIIIQIDLQFITGFHH